ncbi:MAG: sensor histidine kinase [Saprospiraceae bacterium]|nr:sensor histidine kinase [Saprospiraceae bacterium]
MVNKNFTTLQVAFLSAALAGFFVLLTLSLLWVMGVRFIPFWCWIACPTLALGGVFIMTQRLVNFFVYRRIKLIYKYIHEVKTDPEGKKNLLTGGDILESVEQEVKVWAETQQKELETLRALESYRRRFLGNISHELKTPIFNIQGYLHTLLEGGLYDKNINMKYLDRAAKNVDRLETIVSDLETIAQLEAEQMILEMEPFDLKGLVKEVFEDHERLAAEKEIRLQFKQGAESDFQVIADRERIRQVLNNLITNAIKYGKAGGITKLGFYDMDDRILVEVADDGIGIEEPHLKHVFDRFYRVDISRSRELGGSGLGLSIVKHIIEAHKQGITVRSSQGKGSTFGFTLAKAN